MASFGQDDPLQAAVARQPLTNATPPSATFQSFFPAANNFSQMTQQTSPTGGAAPNPSTATAAQLQQWQQAAPGRSAVLPLPVQQTQTGQLTQSLPPPRPVIGGPTMISQRETMPVTDPNARRYPPPNQYF